MLKDIFYFLMSNEYVKMRLKIEKMSPRLLINEILLINQQIMPN